MGFVGLLVLYYVSRPLDGKRWALLGAMTAAMLAAVLFFGSFFDLVPLDFQSALVIVVFLIMAPSVIWVFESLFERISRLIFSRESRRGPKKKRRAV